MYLKIIFIFHNMHDYFFAAVSIFFSAKQFESQQDTILVISLKFLFLSWVNQWSETIFNEQKKQNIMKFWLFINYNDINHQILENINHSNIYLIIEKQDDIQIKKNLTSNAKNYKYIIITTSELFEFKIYSYIN